MIDIELFPHKSELTEIKDELEKINEIQENMKTNNELTIEIPDIDFIERTSQAALLEQSSAKISETHNRAPEMKLEGLNEEEKKQIKEESGWSDEIVNSIQNVKQYEILKNAGLIEADINGQKCLIKENIDLDYTDEDGISNKERMTRGLAPLDSETGKPIEIHHLEQKKDSPRVELTEQEHRTGEYEDGKKNQSLWHDNSKETEVHGEGNLWNKERQAHWKTRAENIKG